MIQLKKSRFAGKYNKEIEHFFQNTNPKNKPAQIADFNLITL